MGLIGRGIGGAAATRALGEAAQGVAEVFLPNATRRMELSAELQQAAMDAAGEEFQYIRPGPFDRSARVTISPLDSCAAMRSSIRTPVRMSPL